MNLKDRVVNIITAPKTEWPVIAAEITDVASLYKGYVIPLAAIPAIASFIGVSLIGVNLGFVRYHVPIGSALTSAILTYVLTLVGLYVSALVVDYLAPKFQSEKGLIQALKLVVFASTPAWLAGILSIIPGLAIIGALVSLYCIYLLYLGMTPLLKTPEAQVLPYMVVSAIVIIVVMIVISIIVGAIASPAMIVPAI